MSRVGKMPGRKGVAVANSMISYGKHLYYNPAILMATQGSSIISPAKTRMRETVCGIGGRDQDEEPKLLGLQIEINFPGKIES